MYLFLKQKMSGVGFFFFNLSFKIFIINHDNKNKVKVIFLYKKIIRIINNKIEAFTNEFCPINQI